MKTGPERGTRADRQGTREVVNRGGYRGVRRLGSPGGGGAGFATNERARGEEEEGDRWPGESVIKTCSRRSHVSVTPDTRDALIWLPHTAAFFTLCENFESWESKARAIGSNRDEGLIYD